MIVWKLPLLVKRGVAFRPGAFDDYYSYALRRRLRLLLVPLILEGQFFSYHCLEINTVKSYFKKNTALSKSQATAAVKGAEKSVKVFLRAVAQLNFHTPA